MTEYDTFIRTDQPTTCPSCGTRTVIVMDLIDSPYQTQIHKCLSINCGFEFIEEEDN
jgi:C4-type Zn-finger protein